MMTADIGGSSFFFPFYFYIQDIGYKMRLMSIVFEANMTKVSIRFSGNGICLPWGETKRKLRGMT